MAVNCSDVEARIKNLPSMHGENKSESIVTPRLACLERELIEELNVGDVFAP
jgi:hypothetical protein